MRLGGYVCHGISYLGCSLVVHHYVMSGSTSYFHGNCMLNTGKLFGNDLVEKVVVSDTVYKSLDDAGFGCCG